MKTTTKLLLGATLVAGLSVSAFGACANHVDMGTKNLTNVATPTETHHAATKGYVDDRSALSWKLLQTHTCNGTVQDLMLTTNKAYLFSINAFHNTRFFLYQNKPWNAISLAYPYNVSVNYSENADVNTTHVNGSELKFNGTKINCQNGQTVKIYIRPI